MGKLADCRLEARQLVAADAAADPFKRLSRFLVHTKDGQVRENGFEIAALQLLRNLLLRVIQLYHPADFDKLRLHFEGKEGRLVLSMTAYRTSCQLQSLFLYNNFQ